MSSEDEKLVTVTLTAEEVLTAANACWTYARDADCPTEWPTHRLAAMFFRHAYELIGDTTLAAHAIEEEEWANE